MDVNHLSFTIPLAAFLLYLNSCFCGFVFDDVSAILNNKDILSNSSIYNLLWNDFWGTPMVEERSHKSYRPLTVLTFRLNYLVSGFNPWSYHLLNAILHSLVCYLVFKMNSKIVGLCGSHSLASAHRNKNSIHHGKGTTTIPGNLDLEKTTKTISFCATLLFVVHPVHTEAVTGVVGRAELLSALFFILSILCYTRTTAKCIILSFVCTILGILSKEQSITVLGVLVFVEILVLNKLSLDDFCLVLVRTLTSRRQMKLKPLFLRITACVGMGICLIYARMRLMQGALPHFTGFDNPASSEKFPARHLTYNHLLSLNSLLLLNPYNLLCDWSMGTVPIITSFFDVRNVGALYFWVLYIIIGLHAVFSHTFVSRVASFCISVITLPFLPASNLFIPVGFVVAERILYIPSIGFCLLVALGFFKLQLKLKKKFLVWFLFSCLIAAHSMKTIHRNFEWISERHLFKSGLKITQRNAKIWNNVGHTYEDENDWKTALWFFKQATLVQPDDIGAHMNSGRMFENMNDFVAAEKCYKEAKSHLPKPVPGQSYTTRINPHNLQLFIRLANLIKKNSSRHRLEEAEKLYEEVIHMRPSFLDAHMNRGDVLLRLNKPKQAIASYEHALSLTTNKADVYFNLGVVHEQMNEKGKALEAYTYAIQQEPTHIKALYNSAVILQSTRDPDLLLRAKSRVERILKLESDHLLAKTVMGSICMDLGDNKQAIQWWREVLKVEPSQRTSLFNIPLLLSKMDDSDAECIEAIKELLNHHSHHVKGWLLYGDVMLNKKKDIIEAQRAFKNVMKEDPSNVQGWHNFCVTLVQQTKLKEAENCLRDVLQLSPHETYISENLAFVRRQLALNEKKLQERREVEGRGFKVDQIKVKEEPTQRETKVLEEDIVYVAASKPKSLSFEAKKIIDKLEQSNKDDRNIDKKLTEASKAIKKLQMLNNKAQLMKEKKCQSTPPSKKNEVDNVKTKAMKKLDELEALL
nr:transmembrane and TPR repeat-containing protein 3 isoform X3 [Ciona intestinalis]|eukprot:XP_018672931.1 transmembrane and TPR repeat-containing protein 3 isoform X3 [Ciona intestinalis]